jgi:hypothetical protein
MFALVTVTHGYCVTKIVRTCDLRASECANKFGNMLKKKKIQYSIVKFLTSRLDVDANRKMPIGDEGIKLWTIFNNKIKDKISINKNKKILLFDIHSFPKGEFDNSQITIIDLKDSYRKELKMFTNYISSKYGINIKLYNGAEDNYVQETYKDRTYPILIEFCEDKDYLLDCHIIKFFEELINYF